MIYSMLFVFWYFIVVVLLDKFLLHEARTNCSIYFIVFHVPVRVGQVWIMVGFFPFLSYVFPWAILRSLTNAHSHMDVIMRICANLESFVRVVMEWFIFGINLGSLSKLFLKHAYLSNDAGAFTGIHFNSTHITGEVLFRVTTICHPMLSDNLFLIRKRSLARPGWGIWWRERSYYVAINRLECGEESIYVLFEIRIRTTVTMVPLTE